MLDMAFGLTDTSRLGCQVKVTRELDGITCTLPSATRNMFVDGMCLFFFQFVSHVTFSKVKKHHTRRDDMAELIFIGTRWYFIISRLNLYLGNDAELS